MIKRRTIKVRSTPLCLPLPGRKPLWVPQPGVYQIASRTQRSRTSLLLLAVLLPILGMLWLRGLPSTAQVAAAALASKAPLPLTGADVPPGSEALQAALVRAAADGDVPAIRGALSQGALPDTFSREMNQMTALGAAARGGRLNAVEALLDAGAGLDASDAYGQTALYRAASQGHAPVVALLLKRGADPNSIDTYNKTPLLVAAGGGYEEVVRLLLRQGAKVGLGKRSGGDPLMWAARSGHVPCVRLLLAAGASPASRNGALAWAYSMGQSRAVLRTLKRAGATPRSVWFDYDRPAVPTEPK